MNEINQNREQQEKNIFFVALSLAWQLGYIIVIPLLLFALGGRLLDRKLDTAPFLFLVGITLSVLATTVWLVLKLAFFTKNFESDNKKEKHEKN